MFSSSSFGISDFTEVFNSFGTEFVHVSNAFFNMRTFSFTCVILFKDIVFPIACILGIFVKRKMD